MRRKGTDVRRKPPPPSKPPLLPHWLPGLVIIWVMLMWTGSIIYSTRNPDWPVPPTVHALVVPVVLGVLGYLGLKGRIDGSG